LFATLDRKRGVRVAVTLALTAACVAYILWKIDVGQTIHVIAAADPSYLVGALAIWVVAVWPLAWRWKRLLAARGVFEQLGWLVRTYFVSYAAGQVLPTSLGGDATRIYSGARRRSGQGGAIAASVLLERVLGGVATLLLAAVGLGLAIGRYDVGPYLWVEAGLVAATCAGAFLLFSRSARRPLRRLAKPLRALRLERAARDVYEGVHAYRRHAPLLAWTLLLTVLVQAVRIIGIWLVGRSVGVDVSPRVYYVMGPLLFLVMLIPFTISGLAVREAFFVSFLGKVGVSADQAFSTGLLFFGLSVALALPGVAIVTWESTFRKPGPEPDVSD
jgi:glycosyltransferase 2 family protein